MAIMRTLILGIGNPILTDDGVGIKIAQCLKEERPGLDVELTCEAAIGLLDLVVGYDKLIIVDSINTESGEPGELYQLTLDDLKPNMDFSSAHRMDIATAFEVGKHMGCKMPSSVSIYAVKTKDAITFAEQCTEEVAEKIPSIVQQIIDEEKL